MSQNQSENKVNTSPDPSTDKVSPQASESVTPPAVRVVNERIAAVASVLGVAQ